MMDISKMSDEVKSALLARAMGLEFSTDGSEVFRIGGHWVYDLYNVTKMFLAWQVHLWMLKNEKPRKMKYRTDSGRWLPDWPYRWWIRMEHALEKPDAQRLWLDKILTLAIEAGIIEEE